ncbi:MULTISPECIES: DUF3310 domain-containing protein [Aerococcus]|uniref:DUF3310 domain-containing protein n=1 Tax=Aerococcus tenax TaxID=3078812 RepID=A0A329PMN9_9LACT|nr:MULTISPECIES: DUF3310 domain-containing protein [Aerococcus]MDL5184757.1 DUF3310 domain-containing protein [Aerococcus mictus]KAA9238587.1 DUF3310 domain-containing protein [Aerococcus urinae]MDK6371982.1 DUF3310 domain-containing protein [Aerococcus urinae]MDK7302422.1 DUF3310 domain-containing protein [Aerococcus urinae]MDK7802281.1 DUF3310 domain-containing protein [Aerococcus urinae]
MEETKIKPEYYRQDVDGPDVIDVIDMLGIEDGYVGFMIGNVLKYLVRFPFKGGLEDLLKAREYLDRLIAREKRVRYGSD